MAICIDGNVVCFGGGCFSQTPTGIEFTGEAVADSFVSCIVPFQGSVSGYTSGGNAAPTGSPATDVIDKFPFASDANATDVGELTRGVYGPAGQSSAVSGYTSAGNPQQQAIDKFPFASDGNATDVGELTRGGFGAAGQSSPVSGYTTGGYGGTGPVGYIPGKHDTIDKFPFASDGSATDVGNLTQCVISSTGHTSTDNGYASGGTNPSNAGVDTIDKFPFASDTNATDVGQLVVQLYDGSGQSSTVSGYTSGGMAPSAYVYNYYTDLIQKFPFASGGSSSDVGELSEGKKKGSAGQSSTTCGYVTGGFPLANGGCVIEKFPFASDTSSTSIGQLTCCRTCATGQQV